MTVTLSLDVGDDERVLLVPVAEVTDVVPLPGGARAVTLAGEHRGIAGAAHTGADGRLRVEVDERPDEEPPRAQTAELEREYRAVVEEILELRGADNRISAFVRSISEMGALADTCAYSPDLTFEQRIELLETVDVVERLSLAVRLQRDRLCQAAARVHPAPPAGVDPQGARRGRRVRGRGLPDADRRVRPAGGRARAGRARGRAARAHGRPDGRVAD